MHAQIEEQILLEGHSTNSLT